MTQSHFFANRSIGFSLSDLIGMNAGLKSVGERALVRLGIERLAHYARRDYSVIIAYHNVVPRGQSVSGDLSLHLSQEKFASQLDVLRRSYEVVSLDALFDSPASASKRPRAVITFDDAYAGAITAGVDELVERGLPATVFVAPALFGTTPWWDKLAASNGGLVPAPTRHHALSALAGKTDVILKWAGVESDDRGQTVSLPRVATEAEVIAAAARPGITLGSHSWSHPNLAALTAMELEAELSRPLGWLRSHRGAVPWLAYPYGLYTEDVAAAAIKTGYAGSFRIDGGLVSRSSHPRSAVPRVSIPSGLSVEGFRLRMVGL